MELLFESKIDLKIENITPIIAKEFLSNNPNNRKLSKESINRYANSIRHRKWFETADPICISTSGQLMNGQHRLHAILQTGVTIPLAVARNVEEKAFYVMDSGKKRSFADVLSILGEKSCFSVGAMTKNLWFWDNNRVIFMYKGGGLSGAFPTHEQLIETWKYHPNIRKVYNQSLHQNKKFHYISSATQGFLYNIFIESYPDRKILIDMFFTKLVTGIELRKEDPILVLRNYLFELKRLNVRTRDSVIINMFITAWNKHILDVPVKNHDELFTKEGLSLVSI